MLKISVVIPTLNRAQILARTIDCIESQTVGREAYEVLVVDNNSSDGTPAMLAEKAALHPNLKVLSQSKRGAAATRNVGIRAAQGEIILFIDDDIFAAPNLIAAHLDYHQQNPNSSIIGAVAPPWDAATEPFLRYLRDRGIFNPYSISRGPMDFSYYHTGNVSTSRKLLLEAGLFNEEFYVYGMEDIELGYRLEKMGCRMKPGPEAKAVHQYFPTYEHFIERCRQAGYSLGKLIELHPELRMRFVENGKHTRWLKHFHFLYRVASATGEPIHRMLTRLERRRGTGPVLPLLRQHYYWAIRYHYFLGYRQYARYRARGDAERLHAAPAPQRIAGFAIERHD